MGKDRGLFLERDAHPTRAHRIISSCAPLLDFPVFAVPMVPTADIGVHLPEKNIPSGFVLDSYGYNGSLHLPIEFK